MRDRIARAVRRVIPARSSASHPISPVSPRVPWWVRWFTAVGRPVVAVFVLGMCAPGEHHLAQLVGFGRMSWAMAGVLAAYAGIAAAVASNRPPGAPGRRSAIAGAFVSLSAAMAAQPVSHLFVTGWLTADPRPPILLVIVVSCVPPLVLGHLLHLAATPLTAHTTPAEHTAAAPVEDAFEDAAEQDEQGEQDQDGPASHAFLTTREVAVRYGVTPSTVGTWKDRAKITPALADPARGNLYDPETLPPRELLRQLG